jgi:hypothetical protein
LTGIIVDGALGARLQDDIKSRSIAAQHPEFTRIDFELSRF